MFTNSDSKTFLRYYGIWTIHWRYPNFLYLALSWHLAPGNFPVTKDVASTLGSGLFMLFEHGFRAHDTNIHDTHEY